MIGSMNGRIGIVWNSFRSSVMRQSFKVRAFFCLLASLFIFNASAEAERPAKIVFVSGKPSHGRMKHEHRAGNMILADALDR